jgi:hypothetical protein
MCDKKNKTYPTSCEKKKKKSFFFVWSFETWYLDTSLENQTQFHTIVMLTSSKISPPCHFTVVAEDA